MQETGTVKVVAKRNATWLWLSFGFWVGLLFGLLHQLKVV